MSINYVTFNCLLIYSKDLLLSVTANLFLILVKLLWTEREFLAIKGFFSRRNTSSLIVLRLLKGERLKLKKL